MINELKLKLSSLIHSIGLKLRKADDTPETIIADICEDIENKITALHNASAALNDRLKDNIKVIEEIERENKTIGGEMHRADNLQRGLDKLLSGD